MEPAPSMDWIKEFGPTGSMAALAFYLVVIIIPKMQTEWREERRADTDPLASSPAHYLMYEYGDGLTYGLKRLIMQ